MEKKDIEIPFGAYDSELDGFEYTIPEGYKAEIKDGKVVVRKTESEDERIRKEMIFYFQEEIPQCSIQEHADKMKEFIAWLEKQGKQKDILEDAILDSNKDGLIADTIRYKREKQGEQKPAEWDILSAKKGDMLSDGNIVLIVDSIEEFEGRPIINSWYFADSKNFYGKGTSECDRWDVHGFRTATETECNYLLKMIDNAGYEWNAEKKELKKIEQKSTPMSLDEAIEHCKEKSCGNNACALEHKQLEKWLTELKELKERNPAETEKGTNGNEREIPNSAWSEEDEEMLENIICDINTARQYVYVKSKCDEEIDWLKSLKDRVQPKQEWSEEDIVAIDCAVEVLSKELPSLAASIERLKSLRPQNTWKPSDEQMEALLKLEEMHVLEHEKNQENAHLYMMVKSIREQLLKLTE